MSAIYCWASPFKLTVPAKRAEPGYSITVFNDAPSSFLTTANKPASMRSLALNFLRSSIWVVRTGGFGPNPPVVSGEPGVDYQHNGRIKMAGFVTLFQPTVDFEREPL